MSKPKKILIVDNDPFIVDTLKEKILRQIDVEILVALSYKDCVHIIREETQNIAVAIIDLELSDSKDGSALHLTNLNTIPSIIFTSSDEPNIKESFLQKHVIEYVVKESLQTLEYTANLAARIIRNFDLNILIVDDSSMSLNLLEITLDKMHFNIYKASDGVEALKILDAEKKFALVITDYHMPNMDGLELTQEIRRRFKKDELSIIVLSGQEDTKSTSLFLKVGANDFIKKPFSYEELALRINLNLEMIDLFNQNRKLATKDAITCVHNERFFADSAQAILLKAERENRELLIASVSIDNFKHYAQNYGDTVAERILIDSAKLIQKGLRKSDLIARQQGETFSILFDNISKKDSEALMEKLHQSFEHLKIQISAQEMITPTISIGAAHGKSASVDAMLKHAYQAMDVSQSSGKNKTTFFEI